MALIDKASLLMVPSTYEAGKLYNVLPSGNRAPDNKGGAGYDQTRADFDFDRGTDHAATRVNSDGLIEKYRENLLLQSNAFDTTWTNVNSTETSGQSGYDGSSNAWLLTLTGGTATKLITQSTSTLSGVYNTSFYAKAGTHSIVQIGTSTQSNIFVCFDLSDGSVGSLSSNAIDAKATSIANGWYRIEVTFLATNATGISIAGVDSISATRFQSTSSTGNFYIQSAQLETGLVATDVLTSGATTAKAGVLVDLPRINYDANGENGSLLLEPSRANKIQFSEYFGAWNAFNSTITNNDTTSPEGITNAAKLAEDSSSAYHDTDFSFTFSAVSNVFSVFAKANGRDKIFLQQFDGGTFHSSDVFDLTNGTYAGGNEGSIEDFGNGWFRCSYVKTTAAGSGKFYINLHNGTSGNYQGDGTSGIYIYGAQAESNATYASSYIPNHGESGGVTRAADSCLGSQDSSLFNDSSMSLFLDLPATNQETAIKEITISDGTTNNRFNVYSVTSNQLRTSLVSGGAVILNYVFADILTNQHLKICITYSGNIYKVFVNGALKLNVTMSTPPVGLDNLNFANATDSSFFYGQVKQAAVFTEALTDAECVTLTTL